SVAPAGGLLEVAAGVGRVLGERGAVWQDVENVQHHWRTSPVDADVNVAGTGGLLDDAGVRVDAVELAGGVEVTERSLLDPAVEGSVVVVPAGGLSDRNRDLSQGVVGIADRGLRED